MMGYVYGAIAAIILSLAGLAYFFYSQANNARAETVQIRADLDAATKVNEINKQTIAALRDSFKFANELAADLAGEVETITTEAEILRDEIQKLKDTDDAVRTYLDTSVPDALRMRYNKADDHRAN